MAAPTELLSIVIGSRHVDSNVLQVAQLHLSDLDGLSGLSRAPTHELRQVNGIGEVKAVQIKAAMELGIRGDEFTRIRTADCPLPGCRRQSTLARDV